MHGEYINGDCTKYSEECGIKGQFNQAHTPHQNGVFKRKTHTIVEKAKIILLESGLPMSLWLKIITYIANYVFNQSPSRINQGRIEKELLNLGRSQI